MPKRLPKLTEAQRHQVEALAAYLTQEQIAHYLGISEASFKNMMTADKSLFSLYKKGQAKAIGAIAQSLMISARDKDNTTAQIFYLKTRGGWKEAKDEPPPPPPSPDNKTSDKEFIDSIMSMVNAANKLRE